MATGSSNSAIWLGFLQFWRWEIRGGRSGLYRRQKGGRDGLGLLKAATDRLGYGGGVWVEDESNVRAPRGDDSGEGGSAWGVFGAAADGRARDWAEAVERGPGGREAGAEQVGRARPKGNLGRGKRKENRQPERRCIPFFLNTIQI